MGMLIGEDDNDAQSRFEAIAMPHLNAAYNLARWLTRNENDADDLVQNAYLRAFRFASTFHGGDARAWLLTIVRNTYFTSLRDGRAYRDAVPFDEELHSAPQGQPADNDPARIVASRSTAHAVNQALEQLPTAFREILVMKEMDDLSYKQIAQVVDIPIGTVMSRLARARKMLLDCLQRGAAGD